MQATIAELQRALTEAPGKGAKFTIHTGQKTHEGRNFDSSFFFVKAVQERPNSFGGGNGGTAGAAPKKFIPKRVDQK